MFTNALRTSARTKHNCAVLKPMVGQQQQSLLPSTSQNHQNRAPVQSRSSSTYYPHTESKSSNGSKSAEDSLPPFLPLRLKALDHIVLTVRDIDRAVNWYTTHLGMKHSTFIPTNSSTSASSSVARHALVYGPPNREQKINLHQSGKEFEPKANRVAVGSADLCFLADKPVEIALEELQAKNAMAEAGDGEKAIEFVPTEGSPKGTAIVERIGARGQTLRSFYIRDLDGNLIEISNYIDKVPQAKEVLN